jgi:hypothetical protein
MKKLSVIVAALFAAVAGLRADTSYLLIQGPFGSGGAEATFKWQVIYPNGVLQYGRDLLSAVFGPPTLSGTYTDAFSGTYEYYTAGNATTGVGYIDFGTTPGQLDTPLVISYTLGGVAVAMDSDYSPGYNYYVAGGSGAQNYPNSGAWTFSQDGTSTRTLADGSYDGWVYGNTFPEAPINGAGNTPTTANFAGATVVVVPEPASAALLLLGMGGLLALKRRRS